MSEHALRTRGHVHTYRIAEFLAGLSIFLLLYSNTPKLNENTIAIQLYNK